MLEIRLLGQFDVRWDGTPVSLPSRPAQSLLAYLVLNPGIAHRREKLAGLLWPESTDANARANLRAALWQLRKAASEGVLKSYFQVDGIAITFEAGSGFWLDAAVLQDEIAESPALHELTEIVSLYQGDLLPGFYDEWVTLERERLRAVFDRRIEQLLDSLVEAGRWPQAQAWAERWIRQGGAPEPAYRALMVAHAGLNNRSKVAAVYARCVQTLRDELGVEPSEQTRAVYEGLVRGKSVSGAGAPARPPPSSTRESLSETPPPTTIPDFQARVGNLPTPLTSFIGRAREMTEISRLLSVSRLVTLTGPGGSGKTRLGLQVAAQLLDEFADGVLFVALAPVSEPALVTSVVAQALDIHESGDRPLEALLHAHLQQKQLLLLLDNCEHVTNACAQLVQDLLQAPRLAVLVTSREPLDIAGERRYPVAPLSLPPVGATPGEAEQFEAIQLFADRARATLPGFAVTVENAHAIARICRHLDGLPLAIELASARVNVLALEQIETRLADRFAWLGSSSRGVEMRHRTLRAAIDWSYEALSAREQDVLKQLSLFVDGCALEAAEAVCATDAAARDSLLEVLSALVDKSLIVAETQQADEARYELLETIRYYAHAKLKDSAEWLAAHDRYLQYFVAATAAIASELYGPNQPEGLNWLAQEHNNIRAALAWSLEHSRVEAGLRLANALTGFWLIRSDLEECHLWFERLLAQANESLPLALHVETRTAAAFVAGRLNDAAAAQTHAQWAVDLCEAAGEAGKPVLAQALVGLMMGAQAAGDLETVGQIVERVVPLSRGLSDAHLLTMALRVGGVAATALGHYDTARPLLAEALALARGGRDPYRTALALNYSGDLARCEQDFASARLAYEESVALLRELGAGRDMAGALHNLAYACLRLGDFERAQALFRESLLAQQALGNESGIAECLLGFAALAVTAQLPGAGARLLAAATAARPALPYRWPAERIEYEHYLAKIRAGLPASEFEVEAARGRSLSMPRAIEYALGLPLGPAALRFSQNVGNLTEREREIMMLIARGRSNGEIAAELVLSKRTVEKHIANILSKLDLANRAQVVRWSLENGLT